MALDLSCYYRKALQFALRAAKSFENCEDSKPFLDVVMCLHVTTAIYYSLGQYSEAIPFLDHSIDIHVTEKGQDHALAIYYGHMQLGDTYAIVGQFENLILCYTMGLEVQIQVMGDKDPRVEATDKRLMVLICETKGDYEGALGHLILASMAMSANGQEKDISIQGENRQTAVAVFLRLLTCITRREKLKDSKPYYENAPQIYDKPLPGSPLQIESALVFLRLLTCITRREKLKDSKPYYENAPQIYDKPLPGSPLQIESALTVVSAIHESVNELDQALKLLKKALKMYNDVRGQQNTIASRWWGCSDKKERMSFNYRESGFGAEKITKLGVDGGDA
ncbi:hypothetical protein AgCh_018384 [Apium graveolens]